MLKPNLASDDSIVDHMPHLVTIYNRAQPSDLVPEMLKQARKFYTMAFKKSRLQISSDQFTDRQTSTTDGVNFISLPEWTVIDDQSASYEEIIPTLKKKLLSLPRHIFGPTVITEKSWYLVRLNTLKIIF